MASTGQPAVWSGPMPACKSGTDLIAEERVDLEDMRNLVIPGIAVAPVCSRTRNGLAGVLPEVGDVMSNYRRQYGVSFDPAAGLDQPSIRRCVRRQTVHRKFQDLP